MTRTVTVVNTVGRNRFPIESNAESWMPLTRQLQEMSVPYQDMNAIIAETQYTIKSEDALLPLGNFTLMLFPKRVDSGNEPDEIVPDDLPAMIAEDDETDDDDEDADQDGENDQMDLANTEAAFL